ncbi:MAG: nuclear transport factor 2 family protein, partial [Steroidobacteraceae bacterium]
MDSNKLNEFAARYTAAWCSQKAASVAAFFSAQGSLKVNDGNPAVGRAAITAVAQGFMSAFPDLVIRMDKVTVNGTQVAYHWTLTGTNTGPGGTGKFVRIS